MSRYGYALTCPEPLAAEAGKEVFDRGGNAMDAVVAAAFAQAVVNPLMCGLGGEAAFCIFDPRSRKAVVLAAPTIVGSRATPTIFEGLAMGRSEKVGRFLVKGDVNQVGYRSVMVPGFVRGLGEAFRQYGSGRLTWGEVLAPATRLAADGFTVDHVTALAWLPESYRPGYPDVFTALRSTPEARRVYLKADGTGYKFGDRLSLPDLARTLDRIATMGWDDFYEGELGRLIVKDVEANSGLFSMDDLRSYRVQERVPVQGSYRGLTIRSCPPPDAGPTIIAMLQILEHVDLSDLGWNSPDYLDFIAHTLVAGFIDSAEWQGDPGFVAVPLGRWISREYAAERYTSIRRELSASGVASFRQGTTHVAAADENQLVVSLNHSTGSAGASGVVCPGLGFLFNNFLGHLDPRPGRRLSILPGKQSGGASSTIIFRDDRPVLTIGAAGGSRLISAIVQSIINMVDHGMAVGEAVSVPRIHAEEPGLLFAEPVLDGILEEALLARGWRVERSSYMGRVAAVGIDFEGKAVYPGSDPRAGRGVAAGSHREG